MSRAEAVEAALREILYGARHVTSKEIDAGYAALALPADEQGAPVDVDALAQFIRKVDGRHDMGAGMLAEHICEWLNAAPTAARATDEAVAFTSRADLEAMTSGWLKAGAIVKTPAGARAIPLYAAPVAAQPVPRAEDEAVNSAVNELLQAGHKDGAYMNDAASRMVRAAVLRGMTLAAPRTMAAQPAAHGWISVLDRLPDPETDVIVTDMGDVFVAAWYADTTQWWAEVDQVLAVTHWMPLPTAPAANPAAAPVAQDAMTHLRAIVNANEADTATWTHRDGEHLREALEAGRAFIVATDAAIANQRSEG